MLFVTHSKEFFDHIGHHDPLNRVMETTANSLMDYEAQQIDLFIRGLLRKVIADDALNLFVETKAALPTLDMHVNFETPYRRRITIRFQGNDLGAATFETKINMENGQTTFNLAITDIIT